jgi:uncharacterized protein (DUF4415 family)
MKNKIKKQIKEIARLVALPDGQIATSDIRELPAWSGAVVGKFYRPIKEPVTIRLDADLLAWLKADGRGYQTRINYLLRRAMLLSGVRHRRRKSRG